jgi:hypothetical protein
VGEEEKKERTREKEEEKNEEDMKNGSEGYTEEKNKVSVLF